VPHEPRAPDPAADASSLDEVWRLVEPFGGWLTRGQALMLWEAAARLRPGGRVVEIGSHHGKSTAVLAAASSPGVGITAIDPFDPGFEAGHHQARTAFDTNLRRVGQRERVDLEMALSQDVLTGWNLPIDLLYIDGAHDPASVRRDLRWVDHVRPGGQVLVHDSFSSVGVTVVLYGQVLLGRTLQYSGRVGSLAAFRVATPTTASRLAMLAQLPWFVRNVAVKVARRLHLMPVARLLGHNDARYDPF
jgi:precorrin-6B methylase 2